MKKRELVRLIKRIMTGADAHTNIIFGKKDGVWICQTGTNSFNERDFRDWNDVDQAHHCCNSISLTEINNLFFEGE